MNTATLARTAATRLHLGLPSGLLRWVQRALAPAAAAAREIEQGATEWVARPLGHTVTCETGTLWLTFDGEPIDVILEAGESHLCVRSSRLAIHALSAARMTVN